LELTGTTFHFVTDGIESAMEQAKAAAGDRDVEVAGGAKAIQQYLAAGMIDMLLVSISPILLGGGELLFENLGTDLHGLKFTRTVANDDAVHLILERP
jgi:dihydrofolate reductase